MKRLLFVTLCLCLAASVFVGCSGEGKKDEAVTVEDEHELAASVEGKNYTRKELFELVAQLPEQQKRKYDNPAGRAELADRFIQEGLFYRGAVDENLESRDDVQSQIEEAKRRILVSAYFKEHVESAARPNEAEIREYYDAHLDLYTTLEVARGQHIFSKSKATLDDLRKRIVEGGEKFTSMAHSYSEDKLTSADGGDMGYFNPGGYIRGIGYDQELSQELFAMEIGQVYGPIKWSRGYSLIRINENRPAALRPYTEVRAEIERLLTEDAIEEATRTVTANLKEGAQFRNYMREEYESVQRGPEELFAMAQATESALGKIELYQEIVDKFPRDDVTPKALFMIGFVYAEELTDFTSADRAFTLLVTSYPDTDMADQARYMIDNMGKGLPEFEEIGEKIGNSR